MRPTGVVRGDMPGPKVYLQWWGDKDVMKQKGIVTYGMSPVRQRALKGMFSGYLFNGYRRLWSQFGYWVVPFAIGYGTYAWAKKYDAWQNSKAAHGEHGAGH